MPNVIIHGDNGVTFPDGTVQGTGLTTGAQTIAGAKTFSSTPTFATLTATLGAAGSVMLPGGLIAKWGSATSGGATNTITYPTAFPTATVFATCIMTSASTYWFPITAKAAASFNNVCYNPAGTPTAGIPYDWMAIGY